MMNVRKEFQVFQNWLLQHKSDYQQILAEKPYCVAVSYDTIHGKSLVIFKYSQIDSDFSNPFVKLCRGLILDASTFEPVSFPFVKFHNYGESYCPNIDWKNCWVGQKVDGSLIKVVKLDNGKLLVSTNGTIDAFKAGLPEQIGCTAKTFGDLFVEAVEKNRDKCYAAAMANHECFPNGIEAPLDWLASLLRKDVTYMFELTSPFNKVVVPWHETKAWLLGERDNKTFEETYFSDSFLRYTFDTPKVFKLGSIEECVFAAEQLGTDEEGFVVCDKDFNRVKIKSPTYVALHHMKNNGVLSYERGLEIVRGNELAEVLTYFPEFKEHLEKIKERYDKAVEDLQNLDAALSSWISENGYDAQHWLIENGGKDRKKLALWLFKATKNPGVGFAIVDGKVSSTAEWLKSMPSSKLVSFLGFKD
jgi:hypothetical protein